MCVYLCVCVFFFSFFFGGGGVKIVVEAMMRNLTSDGSGVESQRDKKKWNSTKQTPFVKSTEERKSLGGVVGVTRHTHEICALPQEEVYENLLCNTSSSLVQRFRSWKETINNRVWLFVGLLSLSRTTSFLPWCIFFPLIFSSIKGKIKFTLRKVPNCQSEFFSDNFFLFFLKIYLFLN